MPVDAQAPAATDTPHGSGRSSGRAGLVSVRFVLTGVAIAAALLVAAACAPSAPVVVAELGRENPADANGTAGARVDVILPPADAFHPAVIEEIGRDVAVVHTMSRPGVALVRSLVPDEDVFVRDFVAHLASSRTDLTCAITTGATSAVRAAHADAPYRRFCALVTTDLGTDEPDGFDLVVLRTAEFGHLVGAAAASASDTGIVAVALAPHDLEQGRFREGLVAALAGVEVTEITSDDDAAEMVAEAVAGGADVVVVGGGPRSVEFAEEAIAGGARLVTPSAIAAALDPDAVVATWRIQWHRVVRGPVDRLLEREPPAPMNLGLAEGTLVLRVRPVAPAAVNTVVGETIRRIIEGELDPIAPSNGAIAVPSAG